MTDILEASVPELTIRFRPTTPVGPHRQSVYVDGDTWGPELTRITVQVDVVPGHPDSERDDTIYVRFGLRGHETNKDGSRSKRRDYEDIVFPDYRNVREYREVILEAQNKALDMFLTAFPAYRDYPVEGLLEDPQS